MTDIILHGCNGKMGRMVGDLISQDPEAVIVAGIDAFDEGRNPYPVFKSLSECDVKADVVIDRSGFPVYCAPPGFPGSSWKR